MSRYFAVEVERGRRASSNPYGSNDRPVEGVSGKTVSRPNGMVRDYTAGSLNSSLGLNHDVRGQW
jgi:hypothetical protein